MEVKLMATQDAMDNREHYKIDVIIPAFNAQATLDRCLASIAMQTIREDLKVTIVDDAGEGSYQKFIDRYSDIMDIQVLRYEKNGGPGVARQYGIDHTNYPYMCFIDADDTLSGAFALQQLREPFYQDEKAIAVWGSFTEETVSANFVTHDPAPIWMFGKLYKRKFWDKYGIRFHATSRYNEDSGVNAIIWLLQNTEEHILKISSLNTYYWHNNRNTITKQNNTVQDYWDGRGFYGFMENRIYTMDNVYAHRLPDPQNTDYVLQSIAHMYCYYNTAYAHKNYMLKDIIPLMIQFQNKYGANALKLATDNQIITYYSNAIKANNAFIPVIGWNDFLQQLQNGTLGSDITFSQVGAIDNSRTQY